MSLIIVHTRRFLLVRAEHLFRKQGAHINYRGYKDLIFQFTGNMTSTRNRIPLEMWMLIRENLNQEPIIEQLHHEIETIHTNYEYVVEDNNSMAETIQIMAQRIHVLERLQLMLERSNTRNKRKIQILRNRIDVLESTQKRRRVGDLLNRTIEYDSTAENSSSSDEVEIIEVSDFEDTAEV